MKKRILSLIIAAVTALSLPVFAYAAGNAYSVGDAQAYVNGNLKNGYLYFEGDNVTYDISGEALRNLYYNSAVKYYLFKANGITVCADKNGFFDFDLKNVTFSLSSGGFNVTYFYNGGGVKRLTEVKLPVLYTLTLSTSNSRTTASFSGRTVMAKSNGNGSLSFETTLVGDFTVVDFEFDDVRDPSQWFYGYVNSAGALGILDGMDWRTFMPKLNVTRAELAAMIVKATQDTVSYRIDPSISFSDVPQGKWYYEYVMKCAALGIVDGVGDGKYNPLEGATREEIATVIARLLKLVGSYGDIRVSDIDVSSASAQLSGLYSDSGSIHDYARESVLICYRLGIMQGDSEGFRARAKTVRAECAKIFYLINRSMCA